MKKAGSGQRTLLASVALSTPGVIAVAIGFILGRSSTQFADFIRRTAELAAVIVSWTIFSITNKDGAHDSVGESVMLKKVRLESIAKRCVGAAMCISGAVMMLIAVLSHGGESGNVIPGLVIAILGVIVNTFFWLRYSKLNKIDPNEILAVQSKLYRAKSFVDICVVAALATIAIAPNSTAAVYMDIAGSVAVSIYLAVNGAIIMLEKQGKGARL